MNDLRLDHILLLCKRINSSLPWYQRGSWDMLVSSVTCYKLRLLVKRGVELVPVLTGCGYDLELVGLNSGWKGIWLDLNWLVGRHFGRTLIDYVMVSSELLGQKRSCFWRILTKAMSVMVGSCTIEYFQNQFCVPWKFQSIMD